MDGFLCDFLDTYKDFELQGHHIDLLDLMKLSRYLLYNEFHESLLNQKTLTIILNVCSKMELSELVKIKLNELQQNFVDLQKQNLVNIQ